MSKFPVTSGFVYTTLIITPLSIFSKSGAEHLTFVPNLPPTDLRHIIREKKNSDVAMKYRWNIGGPLVSTTDDKISWHADQITPFSNFPNSAQRPALKLFANTRLYAQYTPLRLRVFYSYVVTLPFPSSYRFPFYFFIFFFKIISLVINFSIINKVKIFACQL